MRRLRTSRRGKLVIVTLGFALGLTAWMAIGGTESEESRAVKQELTRQSARIQSLEVVYRLVATSDLKPETLRSLKNFWNQLYLANEEWRESYKGTKRFRRQLQPEHVDWLAPTDKYGLTPPPEVDPKASKQVQDQQRRMNDEYKRTIATLEAQAARGGTASRRDPSKRDLMEQDVTRAFNGHSLWMRRPMTREVDEYQVWPTRFRTNWFQPSAYLAATGLHLAEETNTEPKTPRIQGMFQLEKWVKQQNYVRENETEVIDGATCVVLKGSLNSLFEPALLAGNLVDRVWLDRDHGFAVKKREGTYNGQLTERWQNSSFKELEPGLWLPTRCRHDRFALDAPPEFKDKPVVTEQITVEKLEINGVADDRFDMVPREKDRIEDLRGQFP